jgi:hypothetical protein
MRNLAIVVGLLAFLACNVDWATAGGFKGGGGGPGGGGISRGGGPEAVADLRACLI